MHATSLTTQLPATTANHNNRIEIFIAFAGQSEPKLDVKFYGAAKEKSEQLWYRIKAVSISLLHTHTHACDRNSGTCEMGFISNTSHSLKFAFDIFSFFGAFWRVWRVCVCVSGSLFTDVTHENKNNIANEANDIQKCSRAQSSDPKLAMRRRPIRSFVIQ